MKRNEGIRMDVYTSEFSGICQLWLYVKNWTMYLLVCVFTTQYWWCHQQQGPIRALLLGIVRWLIRWRRFLSIRKAWVQSLETTYVVGGGQLISERCLLISTYVPWYADPSMYTHAYIQNKNKQMKRKEKKNWVTTLVGSGHSGLLGSPKKLKWIGSG